MKGLGSYLPAALDHVSHLGVSGHTQTHRDHPEADAMLDAHCLQETLQPFNYFTRLCVSSLNRSSSSSCRRCRSKHHGDTCAHIAHKSHGLLPCRMLLRSQGLEQILVLRFPGHEDWKDHTGVYFKCHPLGFQNAGKAKASEAKAGEAHLEGEAVLGDDGGGVVEGFVGFVGEAVLRGVSHPVGVHDLAHEVVVIRGMRGRHGRVHHQRILVIQARLHYKDATETSENCISNLLLSRRSYSGTRLEG